MVSSEYTLYASAEVYITKILTKLYLPSDDKHWFQSVGVLYRLVDETIPVTKVSGLRRSEVDGQTLR